MSHPNEAMLRAFYEAFPSGDVGSLLAKDVFALVTADHSLSGTHRGRDEFVSVVSGYRSMAPDGLELDLHDVLANDAHGMAIVRVTARRGDDTYDEWETHVFEIEEGAIAGLFVYWNDPAPANAFFV